MDEDYISSKIDECDRCKTGVISRIRRIRGLTHSLQELDVNHLTFWQREICLNGFFVEMEKYLDEVQYLVKNFIEDVGECDSSVECLCNDVTVLEKRVFELEEENDLLKKQIEELTK